MHYTSWKLTVHCFDETVSLSDHCPVSFLKASVHAIPWMPVSAQSESIKRVLYFKLNKRHIGFILPKSFFVAVKLNANFQQTPSFNFLCSDLKSVDLIRCPCASIFQHFLLWNTFINVILLYWLLAQSYDFIWFFFFPSDRSGPCVPSLDFPQSHQKSKNLRYTSYAFLLSVGLWVW